MTKESSLRVSFLDGIFASIMMGFTVNYVTPFAILIGANNFLIGLLNSIPQLFGSIVQLKSADIVKKIKSRVKSITWSVFLQASTYFIICLIFLISDKNLPEIFILLITINNIFGSISTPAWVSLMSDTVDKNKYGEYFSWRGKILGFVVNKVTPSPFKRGTYYYYPYYKTYKDYGYPIEY
ncbi:MAG: MFS transporter [Endomicrobiia bacterium]